MDKDARLASATTEEVPNSAGADQIANSLVVDDGWGAVRRVEAAVCGPDVSDSPAVASGMGAARVRTACLLGLGTEGAAERLEASAPVVCHLATDAEVPAGAPLLAGGTNQELVDLGLVAHLVVEQSWRSVVCVLDPPLAERLGVFEVPSSDRILKLLGAPFASSRVAGERDRQPGFPRRIRSAFTNVSQVMGRRCDPVHNHCAEGAETVLVAAGGWVEPARRLVDHLREAGQAVGLLAVRLVSPFPTHEVAERLDGVAHVLLLNPDHPSLRSALSSGLKRVCRRISVAPTTISLSEARTPPSARLLADLLADARPDIAEWRPPQKGRSAGFDCAVTPAGPWARRLLMGMAATFESAVGDYRIRQAGSALASLHRVAPEDQDEASLDCLILLPQRIVAPRSVFSGLSTGARVVLAGQGPSVERAWASLARPLREELIRREASVWVVPDDAGRAAGSAESLRMATLGAFVSANAPFLPDYSPEHWREVLPDVSDPAAFEHGMRGATRLETEMLEQTGEELTLLPTGESPSRPAGPPAGSEDEAIRDSLRSFHLTGQAISSPADRIPDGPLWPALVEHLSAGTSMASPYPLYLPPSSDPAASPRSLADLLRGSLKASEGSFPILEEHLDYVADIVAWPGDSLRYDLRPVIDDALESLAAYFDLSPAGVSELEGEVAALARHLPVTGELLQYSADSALQLYFWALDRERTREVDALVDEVGRLLAGLEALLLVDDTHSGKAGSAAALGSAVGEQGSRFIDPESLAQALPGTRGPRSLGPERRQGIERTVEQLQQAAGEAATQPRLYLVHSTELTGALPDRVEAVRHDDSFQAALGLFEGLTQRWIPTWRAMRRARLEIEQRYEPELHGPILERLEWQSCKAAELLSVPPILVVESSEALSNRLLTSFGRLLGSGRPLQVLISDDLPRGNNEDLSGSLPELAYLAIAHREAFVAQASLADPVALSTAIEALTGALRPAVLIVPSVTAEAGRHGWLRQKISRDARLHPVCRYDPGAGSSWASRFSLQGNPQPEQSWPRYEVSHREPEGSEVTETAELTPAHALALDPDYRSHFCVIPTEWWHSEQVELSRYLEEYETLPPDTIPYIWVLGSDSVLQRAVLTRDMAHLCRDRRRLWRTLQELAGIDNAYVHEAVGRLRRELTADFERQCDAVRKEALQEGARLAIDRLVEGLTGPPEPQSGEASAEPPGPPPPPAVTGARPPDTSAESSPAVTTGPDAVVVPEPEDEEPYVDSWLCTSCNECTELNPELFKYNDDKQAYVNDPAAGTYAQLVKAAELCPAKCIHPGSPRADDATATEEVRARAATLP